MHLQVFVFFQLNFTFSVYVNQLVFAAPTIIQHVACCNCEVAYYDLEFAFVKGDAYGSGEHRVRAAAAADMSAPGFVIWICIKVA